MKSASRIAAVALAASMAVLQLSCGDASSDGKEEGSTKENPAPKVEKKAPAQPPKLVSKSEEERKKILTPAEEAAPPGDLESHVVGYWAPDAEAIMKEMEEQFKDSPDELAASKAMKAPMINALAFEIPEKGTMVMHMMGDSRSMSYTVKTVDEATKTLTVEITAPDGEPESGSIIIGEDKLRLSSGDEEEDGLSLVRIDEAAFKKRQVVLPNILDLPEGPVEEPATEKPATPKPPKLVSKSEEEWKKILTPEQFAILRKHGTERPWGRAYDEFKKQGEGAYHCAGCNAELFSSKEKFDARCGWPAFFDTSKHENIKTVRDASFGTVRVEVRCNVCDGHLGHIFTGEGYDTPTDQRYCINGKVLKFVPKAAAGNGASKGKDK